MTIESKRGKPSEPPRKCHSKAVRAAVGGAESKPPATKCLVSSSSTTMAVVAATINAVEKCSPEAAIDRAMATVVEHAKRLKLQSVMQDQYQCKSQISLQDSLLSMNSCTNGSQQGRSRLPPKTSSNQAPYKKWNITQPHRASMRSLRKPETVSKTPRSAQLCASKSPPAPPPSPSSPRSPRASQLQQLIGMADNLLKEYKETEQLTNTLLEEAQQTNQQLFKYWQRRRSIDIVDQIEVDYNTRVMETLLQSMRDEQESDEQQQLRRRCASIVRRHAQHTQTALEQQTSEPPLPASEMATQTTCDWQEPAKRIESAISNLGKQLNMTSTSSAEGLVAVGSSTPPVPEPSFSSSSLSSPSMASISRSASGSSMLACEQLSSQWTQRCQSVSFRPIMNEYRDRVQQIRKLMQLTTGSDQQLFETESQDLYVEQIAQLRLQSQRNAIFYEMMHFAEDELLQMLPTGSKLFEQHSQTAGNHEANIMDNSGSILHEDEAVASAFQSNAIVETGVVGDVGLANTKSVGVQSQTDFIGSEQHADGTDI